MSRFLVEKALRCSKGGKETRKHLQLLIPLKGAKALYWIFRWGAGVLITIRMQEAE